MDYGPILAALVLIGIVTFLALRVWRSGDLTRPEETTARPAPVEDIDWLGGWKPVGGPPAWKDVRHD